MKFLVKEYNIKKLRFKTRIILSLIIFTFLLTVSIGIISMQISFNLLLDMSKQLSEKNFNVVYNSLDAYFHNVEKYSTLLIRMPELQSVLKADDVADISVGSYTKVDRSVLELTTLASTSDALTFNIVNIYCKNGFKYNFINDHDFPYHSFDECIDYYINNGYIESGYKPSTWCDIIRITDDSGKKSYSFINIRMLYSAATMEEVGVLVTGINELDMYEHYSAFSEDAYIVHNNGAIISHKNKMLLGTSLTDDPVFNRVVGSTASMDTIAYSVNNETQIATYRKLASNDIIFIVPFDYYSDNSFDTSSFFFSIIIVIIFGLVISVIFTMLISKGLSSSVLSLKKIVEAVQGGDLYARFSSTRNDEIAYLGHTFNNMMDQINNYFIEHEEQERTKRMLEIKLMQSQINPHLLYNTLDSTIWALDNKDLAKAKTLIVSLSEFFKTTLSGGNELIPLEKELNLIINYINIQKDARGKNISLDIQCPDELNQMSFIKLSMQPIVENSILHGFSGFRDDGRLTITVKKVEDHTVEIAICDNGIGMLDEELAEVNKLLQSSSIDQCSKHFGLYNIQRRIRSMFGKEYGIRIDSKVGIYTCVYMYLPINFSSEVNE